MRTTRSDGLRTPSLDDTIRTVRYVVGELGEESVQYNDAQKLVSFLKTEH